MYWVGKLKQNEGQLPNLPMFSPANILCYAILPRYNIWMHSHMPYFYQLIASFVIVAALTHVKKHKLIGTRIFVMKSQLVTALIFC